MLFEAYEQWLPSLAAFLWLHSKDRRLRARSWAWQSMPSALPCTGLHPTETYGSPLSRTEVYHDAMGARKPSYRNVIRMSGAPEAIMKMSKKNSPT
jgi:hypothetical protein